MFNKYISRGLCIIYNFYKGFSKVYLVYSFKPKNIHFLCFLALVAFYKIHIIFLRLVLSAWHRPPTKLGIARSPSRSSPTDSSSSFPISGSRLVAILHLNTMCSLFRVQTSSKKLKENLRYTKLYAAFRAFYLFYFL